MRCEAHGLAAGPDGHCVLCKRTQPPAAEARSPRIALLALGLACAAGAALGGVALLRSPGSSPPEAREEPLPIASEPAEEPAAADTAEEEPDEPARSPPPATQWPGFEPAAPPAAPAASASSRPRSFSEAEIRAAMRRVPVTVYTTSWCPVCVRALGWMRANQVSFVEYDVELSPIARRAQRALNPKGSVPTIDLDGEVFVGFNEQRLAQALVRKAVRRLETQ
jgi:glutaredoxin 3